MYAAGSLLNEGAGGKGGEGKLAAAGGKKFLAQGCFFGGGGGVTGGGGYMRLWEKRGAFEFKGNFRISTKSWEGTWGGGGGT